MKIIALAVLLGLAGCSTYINYSTETDPNSAIQSTALRFRLQESSIALTVPAASGSSGSSSSAVAKSNCPENVDNTDWAQCFARVSAQSAPLSSTFSSGSVYVATPENSDGAYITTTTFSSTPITGQDGLYSVVTVNYSNNASAAITAAGTGAATGFGLVGPYGAAAGFLLGAAGAIVPGARQVPGANPPPAPPPPPSPPMAYICPGESVDLSGAADNDNIGTQTPSIFFPIVLNAPNVGQLAPYSQEASVDLPTKTNGACWHVLPNGSLIGSSVPISTVNKNATRTKLQPGDGWLYRIVADSPQDPTAAPPGSEPVGQYFGTNFSNNPHSDFPYSSCRSVMLQITWWQDLANAIKNANAPNNPNPSVLTYKLSIADPKFVSVANLQKGGSVNFKPDCGATISTNPDLSNAALLNATVTAAESIYKAEQTWAAGKSTAAN